MHPVTHTLYCGDMLDVLVARAERANKATRESRRIHMDMGEEFAERARDW